MPDEDSLRHKYAPLPEEPRYRKKAKKKHTRSDHKHDYEQVCVDDHSFVRSHGVRLPCMNIVKRCKVCGRIGGVSSVIHEPPKEDMPLYVVPDCLYLWTAKALPSELEVGNAGKEDA